jgi:hypothetical protein
MDQAVSTASHYFLDAVKAIDSKFGDGYAKSHPELIGAFMNAAAADYATWSNGTNTAHLVDAINEASQSIQYVAETVSNLDLSS